MLMNSNGEQISNETSIFPIVSFDPGRRVFTCLGTGFFITPTGGFITAKHVFIKPDGTHQPTLYGIQSFEDGTRSVRVLNHISTHMNVDIAIGMLGHVVKENGFEKNTSSAPFFQLSFDRLKVGDEITTYAFPNTKSEWLEEGKQAFTFKGIWSTGVVEDYHQDGFGLLKNSCYQTSMRVDSGASGGPVFKDSKVVGINSTGMELFGNDFISGITPVWFIKDLVVSDKGRELSVSELISEGHIIVI